MKREVFPCGDCGVATGELHAPNCDQEKCPLCGWQMLTDKCIYTVNGMDPAKLKDEHPRIYKGGPTRTMRAVYAAKVDEVGGRIPWEGFPPGTAECEELGLYCRWVSRETGEPMPFDRVPGIGMIGKWVPCGKEDAGADFDWGRLDEVARWDAKLRRYVAKN
jgi:hypothetical protein